MAIFSKTNAVAIFFYTKGCIFSHKRHFFGANVSKVIALAPAIEADFYSVPYS
jgi:hypothetical protein